MTRSPSRLVPLADGVHHWAPDGSGTWGWANCVLVSSGDQAALLDTPYTAGQTRRLQAAAAQVLPAGARITTVVNTHANGDHSFGNCLFEDAEVLSTASNLEHAHVEPGPDEMRALLEGTDPDSALGWYVRRHFPDDFAGLRRRVPTRGFTGRERLTVGELTLELIETGPAHTPGDLIAHVPERGVVCAGDVVFIGDHAVHWAGPIAGVLDACDTIRSLRPDIIVPGHGPVIDLAGLERHCAYLRQVRERIHTLHAQGRSAPDTAAELLADDRHPELGLPERLVILTATEYRHLDGDTNPPDVVALVGSAAEAALARELAGSPGPATPARPATTAGPTARTVPAPATPPAGGTRSPVEP